MSTKALTIMEKFAIFRGASTADPQIHSPMAMLTAYVYKLILDIFREMVMVYEFHRIS